MAEPSQEQIHAAGEAAVSAFFQSLGGQDLSTGKYVLMAEVINAEGKRNLWMVTAQDQMAWDTLGLLDYGVQTEQAARLDFDDDE